MDQQHDSRGMFPAPTAAARRRSSTRIAAARVPTEPTSDELLVCEARLELTAMRDRCTARPRRAS